MGIFYVLEAPNWLATVSHYQVSWTPFFLCGNRPGLYSLVVISNLNRPKTARRLSYYWQGNQAQPRKKKCLKLHSARVSESHGQLNLERLMNCTIIRTTNHWLAAAAGSYWRRSEAQLAQIGFQPFTPYSPYECKPQCRWPELLIATISPYILKDSSFRILKLGPIMQKYLNRPP